EPLARGQVHQLDRRRLLRVRRRSPVGDPGPVRRDGELVAGTWAREYGPPIGRVEHDEPRPKGPVSDQAAPVPGESHVQHQPGIPVRSGFRLYAEIPGDTGGEGV